MNELHIRDATSGDLSGIVALEQRVFSYNQLPRRSFRYYLKSPGSDLFVAEAGGALIGYALVCYRTGSRGARLYSICADNATGRRGVGRELLKQAEMRARARRCETMQLEVKDDNAPAIRLYRAMHYQEFGRYEDYYEDGRNALRFRKSLVAHADAPDAR